MKMDDDLLFRFFFHIFATRRSAQCKTPRQPHSQTTALLVQPPAKEHQPERKHQDNSIGDIIALRCKNGNNRQHPHNYRYPDNVFVIHGIIISAPLSFLQVQNESTCSLTLIECKIDERILSRYYHSSRSE